MTETASRVGYRGSTREAGSPCYRCQGQKSPDGQLPVKIRVAVFFDGTLNNRTNTGLGEKGVHRGVSYETALTNVAILELYYRENPEYDYSFSVYIEGIGTEDEEGDSLLTAGTGEGSTGILAKVEKGIFKAFTMIDERLNLGQSVDLLHLDSFGFSRGAAAARNFIHSAVLGKRNTLKHRLQSSGHDVREIQMKFVGLFDTVASYGFFYWNDSDQLHLDSIRHAQDVVQLAAAEEHRRNFPLTNINSAPHGIQIFLPDAHSDVGGGYVDNMDEVDHRIMFVFRRNHLSAADRAALAREKDWVLASGWYHEDEIHKEDLWIVVKATRRAIRNCYHRIPLQMMAKFAIEKGITISTSLMNEYNIPPDLRDIHTLINESPLDSPEYWLNLKTDLIRKLRHDYLHFSAYFGSPLACNEPHFTDNNPVSGTRKREVYDG